MKLIFWHSVTLFVALFIPGILYPVTLQEALDEAASYFVLTATHINPGEELNIREILNLHSQKEDETSRTIKRELYIAFEKQNPDFKLSRKTGVRETNLNLTGIYEKEADKIALNLKVARGKEVISQYQVSYDTEKDRKTRVAVLDIEAEMFNQTQRMTFSNLFRFFFKESSEYDMITSSEIDKLSQDSIQRKNGSILNEYLKLGKKLGADSVVLSYLFEINNGAYLLYAKVVDVEDGTVLFSKTVEHTGDLTDLDRSLEKLARQLTANQNDFPSSGETASNNLRWHITAISLAALSVWMSIDETNQHNDLSRQNGEIKDRYKIATTQAELSSLHGEYDDNVETMNIHKRNVILLYSIAALSLAWETYLFIYSDDSEPEHTAKRSPVSQRNKIYLTPLYGQNSFSMKIALTWNF